ncbi:Cystathionine beta-synthase [Psilocybe cubensis]|uniref:Cystathionine beta-synthase n=2 Tax=Psilocybe cubensis TaxID=181762 RepID=A0ACB8GRV4_PSICU|nr:Cystathionine beta-synthase [Psilocybe cubensis]KAH9477956.1 Cystathionine beta-synthase [Psilocybe cubensis]
MATATMSSFSFQPSTLPADKYRGAVVEDLQLPPAFSVSSNEAISRAIELAYERDFSHIPVLDQSRRPLGYVDVAKLKQKWEAGQANPDDKVSTYMTKFKRTSSEPYTVITPLSPLSDLEDFLKRNIFALVTDQNRKFVLAVATSHDLDNFVSRRGL